MDGYYKSNSNRCYFSSGYRIRNPFFITPHTSERREQRKNHHNQIVDTLNVWYKKDIKLNEELNFKTINSLYIKVLEDFGLDGEIIVNDKNPQTVEQMILSHLNSEEYSSAQIKYATIKNIQNEHNNLVLEFINNYKQKLKQLLGVDTDDENENKIETLLQFILYKTYYAKNVKEINLESILEYETSIMDGENYPSFILDNPYPQNREKIPEFVNQNFNEIKKYLTQFNTNFKNMNNNISEFKKQLKPIIDTSTIGLKGKCFIENRLSIFYPIKKQFKCIFD